MPVCARERKRSIRIQYDCNSSFKLPSLSVTSWCFLIAKNLIVKPLAYYFFGIIRHNVIFTCRHFLSIQILINHPKTDLNLKSDGGITPLMAAVKVVNQYMLKLLIKKSADIAATDNDGRTALHWAAMVDNLEALKLLIRHGPETIKDAQDNKVCFVPLSLSLSLPPPLSPALPPLSPHFLPVFLSCSPSLSFCHLHNHSHSSCMFDDPYLIQSSTFVMTSPDNNNMH